MKMATISSRPQCVNTVYKDDVSVVVVIVMTHQVAIAVAGFNATFKYEVNINADWVFMLLIICLISALEHFAKRPHRSSMQKQ